MRHPRTHPYAALLLYAMAALPACAGQPVVSPDPVAQIPRASVAPAIDGLLSDACWQQAPAIPNLTAAGGKLPRKRTSVHVACGADTLYVAFRCADSREGELRTGQKYIWRDDSVEVLLDCDRDRRDYLHFFVSVSGARLAWRAGVAGATPDRGWNQPWQAAAARMPGGWSAEMAIPFRSLDIPGSAVAALRANFARNEQELAERTAWMPRQSAVLNAHSMGNLVFSRPGGVAPAALAELALTSAGSQRIRVMVKNADPLTRDVRARACIGLPGTGRAQVFRGGRTAIAAGATDQLEVRAVLPRAYQSFVDVWADGFSGSPTLVGPSLLGPSLLGPSLLGPNLLGPSLLGPNLLGPSLLGPSLLGSFRIEMPGLTQLACGAVLANTSWGTVWEASATAKVLPQQEAPRARGAAIRLSCAGNEYEPFQIVLRPSRSLDDVQVKVSDLRGPAVIAGETVSVRLVGTVPVTEPTGPDCAPGDYPDPLMPLERPDLPAGINTALWFTVYAPASAQPGEYRGQVTLAPSGEQPLIVPVQLRVWGFSLPEIPHLQTAYGCDVDTLCRWQGVTEDEDKKKVADLAWKNFLRHRVSPFSWRRYWDIDEEVTDGVLKLDFTDYDAGHDSWLPFANSFNVPGAWMRGVGRRGFGEEGYPELKKQFVRQVAEHLRAKGWFEKGYNYIFDEPDEDKYADVIAESRLWREAAPGLRILLTEQPEPALEGWVDIWTPVLDAYNEPACRAAQQKGDEIWWYVCMGPKHPFPNNFIDYPAIDHRILHWMNWNYGVTGVLYWQTTYWKGDPWETPMSYADDGKPFGNGDGRLLYPAIRKPSEAPAIEGPMDSIRWELIREGIEDYDYLTMLSQKVREAETAGEKSARVRKANAALNAARGLVRTLVDYETDPARLYDARMQVAEALESFAK